MGLVISCPALAGNIHIGDSTANPGTGATVPAYVPQLDAAVGGTWTNLGHPGDQMADQALYAYGTTLGASDIATVFGINDHWKYGPSKVGYYQAFLTGVLTHLAAPSRTTGQSAGMTLTGAWTVTTNASAPWAVGKWSNTLGSTATATVSGTAVYIDTILQNYLGAPTAGSANVIIDGIAAGSFSSNGVGINTVNGPVGQTACCYAPGTFRFGGLSAGSHTVQIQITSGFIYLEAIAGSAQAIKPKVYVSTTTRMSAAGYAALGNTSSDANVATYNGVISGTQGDLAADGLNVALVDSYSAVNPSICLYTDGAHPNDCGYAAIFAAFRNAILGPPAYSPAVIEMDSANNFYGRLATDTAGTTRRPLH